MITIHQFWLFCSFVFAAIGSLSLALSLSLSRSLALLCSLSTPFVLGALKAVSTHTRTRRFHHAHKHTQIARKLFESSTHIAVVVEIHCAFLGEILNHLQVSTFDNVVQQIRLVLQTNHTETQLTTQLGFK
jgi:hypothetical protein